MALFLITGLPGTGKSTLCNELKARGYEAYDGDYDGLAHWYNTKTGRVVKAGDEERTPEFVHSHSRNVARKTVEDLAIKAKNKPVFLCNDPENEDELRGLFTMIFALALDENTRQHRLVTRANNDWGKLPHERKRDQLSRKKANETYKKYNYFILDATKPTNVLADEIEAAVKLG